ncbi:Calcium-transporting ATPase 1 [Lentilactobacillus parabuchneri]|uniref:Calcium-transporting ATPase 1 n=4 Tax=Lentilactobacillus parabuchneri TaxID=152331 RepID=A0A1X1FI20_9LACO|nr:P-type (transporting) HAD superfamily ATPase [Lentilactobacillus parabuchneri DSM 5707 = NBRC 107865]KRN77864.1 P-type (transporting) HAD superfamily ATPase [Lentilactobacillus parabuchneri]OBU97522.1 haloacid dehalogenase [Lentilactobacillus parabuchneri]OCB82354.1 haloacid dehalogenase [Lentilactobacillus parabuchneri]OCB83075.1 haloacid dehalogenase [Lentilactobacillus parabuchneri]
MIQKNKTTLIDDYAKADPTALMNQFQTGNEGLSGAEAEKRLQKYGPNTIQQGKKRSEILVFLANFTSMMAILLWVSGIIAMFAGMMELGIAIWAVNVINGCFSYWQQHAAQKATDSLKKMLPSYVKVRRDGKSQQIQVEQLVPGDVFDIQAGDSIPADARVFNTSNLQIDESSLTGESVPVEKKADYHHGDGEFAQQNIVFAGTVSTSGTATALALATGMDTEFGRIATLTQSQKKTIYPLERELNHLTRQLTIIAIGIGVAFFLLAIFFVKYPIAKSFIFALGMIVAFIPEGLLPTVTLSLAQGTQRMAKKHALLKNLSSVETLGQTTVICSDKTGTLTQNQMTINHIWLPGKEYDVTGTGYLTNGKIQLNGKDVDLANELDLNKLLINATINNDTEVTEGKAGEKSKILGTPTEAGLVILSRKAGIDAKDERKAYPRLKELPFDSDRKLMTVITKDPSGQLFINTKGALGSELAICDRILDNGQVRPITDQDRATINQANETYSKQGLRTLAFSYRIVDGDDPLAHKSLESCTIQSAETHMIFVGLTMMSDPPRPEIFDAVKNCKRASIRIIMVTGDSPITAKSIATRIGITSDKARVISGDELDKMSDDDLQQAVKGEVIFARVAPEHKFRIVSMCQKNGDVVASTGDGVNDAPALKRADIGIAMGVTGTDVAKDAADMILTDDNFASIVSAIEEGRTVYSNLQKFLLYILTSNVPEAAPSVIFLVTRGLVPLPLTVMQILTVDLGTDLLPALGLGTEKAEPGIMDQPPRPLNSHLLNRSIIWKAFGWYGLIASVVSTAAYFYVNHVNGWPNVPLAGSGMVYAEATTITLGAIVFSQIAAAMNCRTQISSVFSIGLFSNHRILTGIVVEVVLIALLMYVPFLQGVFNTGPLNLSEWIFLFCIPVPIFLIEELRKYIVRRIKRVPKVA